MILDADTLTLASGVEPLLAAVEGCELPVAQDGAARLGGRAEHGRVRRRRGRARRGACAARGGGGGRAGNGLRIAAAGAHPLPPRGAGHRPRPALPRFRRVRRRHGQRQGVYGLHVHVGMPGRRRACARWKASCPGCRSCSRCRRIRPTWRARRRAWPRRAPRCSRTCPARGRRRSSGPARSGRSSWSASSRIGLAADYTRIWWDVRAHRSFGTLEMRAPTSRPRSRTPPPSPPSCRRSA